MKKILTFFLFFLLGITFVFSQQNDIQKDMLEKAQENHVLILKDPEQSFEAAQKIEKEALKSGAKEAELLAINTQCIYFKIKNDVEKGKAASRKLAEKADEYGNYNYQIFAKVWISDYYIYNKLYEQALAELEEGSKIVKKTSDKDTLAIRARSNLYLAYCNYYLVKKDYKNQLKYAKLSINEYEKYPVARIRDKQLFLDYSNLAAVYYDINIDSARYYAELSLSKDITKSRSDVRFNNFLILGMVEMEKNNPEKALEYFFESEKNTDINNNFTVPDLYENIIAAYKKLGRKRDAEKYIIKRDSLKLKIAETRNNSLYKTLEEEKKKKTRNTYYLYLFGILTVIVIVVILIVYFRKKRKLEQAVTELPKSENYKELLEMLKKNDPAFIPYFNELFPEFNTQLLKINPKLLPSDLEFCALLKLKIPTHNIAQYKNITTKSVQNKKYNIRKKLDIPTETDIYSWFEDI